MSDSIKLAWKDPTTLSDGTTAIPTGDFAYVDVQMSAGAAYTSLAHVLPGVQAYTVTNLVPGTYKFNLYAVDSQAPPLQSAAAALSVTIPEPPLAPVASLTGTVQ